jgi:hypothetical protein
VFRDYDVGSPNKCKFGAFTKNIYNLAPNIVNHKERKFLCMMYNTDKSASMIED